jgi:hypothetical protein
MFYPFETGDLKSLLSADYEVLHQSCQADFSGWFDNHGTGTPLMRKIEFGIKDNGYLNFLSVCIGDNLSVGVNLKEIIRYRIITYGNSRNVRHQKLF